MRALVRWTGRDPLARIVRPGEAVRLGKSAVLTPYATKLVFTGNAADYISTPDSPALNIWGASWEVRIRVAPVLWNITTVGWNEALCGQWEALAGGANSSFYLDRQGSSTRFVRLTLEKPAGARQAPATQAYPAWVDGDLHWIRVAFNLGTAQADFYQSIPEDGATWTLINSVATGTTGSPPDSNVPLRVGSFIGTPHALNGYVKRFELRSPIGGAIVAGFDASQAKVGAATVQGLAGELWTLQGAASFQ